MILSVAFQIEVFITTIITGVLIGFFYDILKLFRLLILHNRFFIDLEDIVFWLVMSVLVFFVSLYQADGEVRMYFLIGIFLGIAVYFGLFSIFFMRYAEYIINKIKYLIKLVLSKIIAVLKNIKNSFKNTNTNNTSESGKNIEEKQKQK